MWVGLTQPVEDLNRRKIGSSLSKNCRSSMNLHECVSELLKISPSLVSLSVRVCLLSHSVALCHTWTVAQQVPLSMSLSRPEYWSGLPFPSPGDLPNPGVEPVSYALQEDSLPSELPGKPPVSPYMCICMYTYMHMYTHMLCYFCVSLENADLASETKETQRVSKPPPVPVSKSRVLVFF